MPLTKVPASMADADVATQDELDAVSAAALAAAALKLPGDTVQVAYAENSANTVISTVIPADNTIPQVTEGTQVLSASITPTAAENYLLVEATITASELTNVGDSIIAAVFRDGGANAVSSGVVGGMNGGGNHLTSGLALVRFRIPAGSTAATTFTVRVGNNTGSCTLNATHQNINLGGTIISTLTITEIKA
jgi:hypothetical protein